MKVELVRPDGSRQDITYASGLEIHLSSDVSPEMRALFDDWIEQRRRYEEQISRVFGIPEYLFNETAALYARAGSAGLTET